MGQTEWIAGEHHRPPGKRPRLGELRAGLAVAVGTAHGQLVVVPEAQSSVVLDLVQESLAMGWGVNKAVREIKACTGEAFTRDDLIAAWLTLGATPDGQPPAYRHFENARERAD